MEQWGLGAPRSRMHCAALESYNYVWTKAIAEIQIDGDDLRFRLPLCVVLMKCDGYYRADSPDLRITAIGDTPAEAESLFKALVGSAYKRYNGLPSDKLLPKAAEFLSRVKEMLA